MNDHTPVAIADLVKGKIRELIGELIPDAEYDQIVRSTYDQFVRVELPKLVLHELSEHFTARIKAELSGPDWQDKWGPKADGSYGHSASVMVRQLMIEAAPDMFQRILEGAVLNTVRAIKEGRVFIGN